MKWIIYAIITKLFVISITGVHIEVQGGNRVFSTEEVVHWRAILNPDIPGLANRFLWYTGDLLQPEPQRWIDTTSTLLKYQYLTYGT